MEKKSYEKRQRECGLKVCDKVRVIRKAEDYEDGWEARWVPGMSECVGDTGIIEAIHETFGVRVKTDNYGEHYFPYFALEKAEEKKLTSYSVFTICDQGEDFFFITAISKEENNESIIFTEENGGTWEFYKKHIVAIKKA